MCRSAEGGGGGGVDQSTALGYRCEEGGLLNGHVVQLKSYQSS